MRVEGLGLRVEGQGSRVNQRQSQVNSGRMLSELLIGGAT